MKVIGDGTIAYSTKDLTALTGAKENLVRQWKLRGFIRPSISGDVGKGKSSLWSWGDVLAVACFKRIRESGFSSKLAARLIEIGPSGLGKMSDWDLGQIKYVVYARDGDTIKSMVFEQDLGEHEIDLVTHEITTKRPKPEGPEKSLSEMLVDMGMPCPDDIYVIDFRKLLHQVSERQMRMTDEELLKVLERDRRKWPKKERFIKDIKRFWAGVEKHRSK